MSEVTTVLKNLVKWARVKSPWILHMNCGSCNGCDIEILATLIPRLDVERFGVLLKGTPRHADVMVCTGPVTKQMKERLKRVYDQMPEPKFVVVVGQCGSSGGIYHGAYGVEGGIDTVIPVDAYIPGCPPRPDAIVDGLIKLLTKINKGGTA
jgi:NADH-quinone oxidoreductase B subunit